MNKISTLKTIIAILLLINIALLAIPFFKGGHKGKPSESKSLKHIKKEFRFDDAQMAAFKEAKDEHSEKIDELRSSLDSLSKKYFKTPDGSEKEQLLNKMEQKSTAIIKVTDKHFKEIRKICNDDQLEHMEEFIESLLSRNKNKRPRKRK